MTLTATLQRALGASKVSRRGRIQTLWGGYGEAARYDVRGGPCPTVVVKHIRPGRGGGRSHERKLRSYRVEKAWYTRWASRCDDACRVPRCLHASEEGRGWLFVLEDLDAEGFSRRTRAPNQPQLHQCLRWLAAFHARFLGEHPTDLWEVGTYWHLATRPDELAAMSRGPLKGAAEAIDDRLNQARYLTLVHGDAKPANFCFAEDGDGVAAVDFQYVGGGCGVRDVAYLLTGEDRAAASQGLDVYFDALADALQRHGHDADAVVAEWRDLYPWAAADFQRFLAGWSPGWGLEPHEEALTQQVLASLRSR